jgi:hypothetical protein
MSHSKKLMRGLIHKVLMMPVNINPSTIKKPHFSNLSRARDCLVGKSPERTRPPSKGGIGSRLKISRLRFHKTPAWAIELKKGSLSCKP